MRFVCVLKVELTFTVPEKWMLFAVYTDHKLNNRFKEMLFLPSLYNLLLRFSLLSSLNKTFESG